MANSQSRKGKRGRSTASRAKQEPSTDLRGVPVLIVDDDVASTKLLKVILKEVGCQVRVAHSAEEASSLLSTFRPRLITVDLILPLMSGLLFTQRLKADPATRDIVVIAVTVFNGPTTERAVLDAGCAAYVQKPIDPLSFTKVLIKSLGEVT